MPRPFRLRGIVEGFYGAPWSASARRDVLSFVAPLGMNAYVYAPKDDPFHRQRWRDAYPAAEQAELADLAAHARGLGVRFGFAISPGLDITYESPVDREQLMTKLAPLLDAGVDWFVLALDDIPAAPGLAARQADLATWMLGRVRDRLPDAALTVCPTEYVGTRPSPYLAELAAGMPDAVSLLWTGPTVCSPTVTVADASSWIAAVAPHDVLLWDNYPVNDGTMAGRLHLGPYEGRDAGLADVLTGVLLNPMTQAHASLVALGTASSYLTDPDAYDSTDAWGATLAAVGEHAHAPLRARGGMRRRSAPISGRTRARAARRCPRPRSRRSRLGRRRARDSRGAPAHAGVARRVRGRRPSTISPPRSLRGRPRPHARPPPVSRRSGCSRAVGPSRASTNAAAGAAAPDADFLLQAVFALVFSWSGARANTETVFGPRFAIYPAVVQTASGRPAVDVGLTVLENANAIDRLCRIALREYERWRADADETVTALVDGEERAIAADGSFDARGAIALVRSGALVTQVHRGEDLPDAGSAACVTVPETLSISIVMPAYNEATIIERSLAELLAGLRSRGEPFEIVVVENGSTDDTERRARQTAVANPEIRVLHDGGCRLRKRVATGVPRRAPIVVNFDCDYYDLGFIERAVDRIREDDRPAIVVGSKRAEGADDRRHWSRRFVTATFSTVLRVGFRLKVSDTHGMKALVREPLLPVVARCRYGRDLFDTELILRAEQAGLVVAEIPVDVEELRPARTSVVRRIPRTLSGLSRLWFSLRKPE